MSQIYLVRHGQTLFNALRRKQGWCDSPLTDLGVGQARRAGAVLRARGISFDHFYSSPSERACDTLELIMGELGCADRAYVRDKKLKEQNFGLFEGLTEDVNPPAGTPGFYAQFGGESEDEAQERIVSGVTAIMGRPGHERVLAVTHGGAIRFVLRAGGREDLVRTDLAQPIPNAAILVCDWDGARLIPCELIDPAGEELS